MTTSVPMVRIVVLTFDGGELTLDCLASIDALDWPRDRLEVVLVDNGSLDDVAERVRATMPWVTVVEPLRNLGFAGGCNLGITHEVSGTLASQFDYVALVNNDATLHPAWLREAVAHTGPDIGGVATKMLFHERYQRVHVEVLDEIEGSRRDQLGVCVSAVRIDGERCDERLLFDEGFHGPVAPDVARDHTANFESWPVMSWHATSNCGATPSIRSGSASMGERALWNASLERVARLHTPRSMSMSPPMRWIL